MPEVSTNFAVSTVATAPSPATSGTSLAVQSGHGTRFPNPATANFNAIVCPAAEQPTPDNAEIVRVTAKSTDTFTITRAQESTSARSIIVGDRIFAGPTAGKFYDKPDIDTSIAFLTGLIGSKVAQSVYDTKVAQLDADRGLAGMYAPMNTFSLAGTALVSNTFYVARFRPTRAMAILSMQCVVSAGAGASTDQVEVGIGTASGTSLALVQTSGSVNSGFNTTGRKSFNLTATANLTAGTTYYAFLIATSTASLIQANFITTSGGQFAATTLATGAEVYQRTSGLTPGISFPATSVTNGAANVPLLFLHE